MRCHRGSAKRDQPVRPGHPFPSKQHHHFAVMHPAEDGTLFRQREYSVYLRTGGTRRDLKNAQGARFLVAVRRGRKEEAKKSDTTGGHVCAERHSTRYT